MKKSTAQMALDLLAPLYLGMASSRNSNGSDDASIISIREAITAPEAEIAQPVALNPEIEGRLSLWLTLGKELHPLTVNLVVRFARALAAKLADAENKYGYSDGWRNAEWMDECRKKLMQHIEKGDPRDVAAYCAFLWHHGESTAGTAPKEPAVNAELLEAINALLHQIDIGDFVDGHGHNAKMLKPVHDLMMLLVPAKVGGEA